MDGILAIAIGILLGALLMYWLFTLFYRKKTKERSSQQSIVLLEKMKKVCKLISVEGDFAEIYTYKNTKERFLSLYTSKKKALVVIRAKVHVGYDLSAISFEAKVDRKTIVLTHFPQPQVLSVESDLEFYDIKNDLFNSFSPDDHTQLNKEAKQHITEKVPESGLLETARKEALDAVFMMQNMVEAIGWNLDYTALEVDSKLPAPAETIKK